MLQHLMGTLCFGSIEALDARICALGKDCAQLEEEERQVWAHFLEHCPPSSLQYAQISLRIIEGKRKVKDWDVAMKQLEWIEELQPQDKRNCFDVWKRLKQNHEERAALANLRSFHDDIRSPMNLDNCFDMLAWELVEGGASGFHTSKSHAGVFKAKGVDDNKTYAVKCVRPEFPTPENVKTMKREVESHSILVDSCVLQYAGDYSTSSSHFLKFILEGVTEFRDVREFSKKYLESRNFLFIATEFCGGGNMVHYVHGHPRPINPDDSFCMAARAVETPEGAEHDKSSHFQSYRSHHLCVCDHVVMIPPGCHEHHSPTPFLAKVVKVSECPQSSSEFQDFWVCPVPESESLILQYSCAYLQDSKPFLHDPDYHFYHVHVDQKMKMIHRTMPRPGFAFLKNFCFQAIKACHACSLKYVYHGDIRLENFFLRQPLEDDEFMCGEDEDCHVEVQLGDFDLATAGKNHALEFATDRLQLIVVL